MNVLGRIFFNSHKDGVFLCDVEELLNNTHNDTLQIQPYIFKLSS